MKPPVDLHIHSTFSDGTCTVDEIAAQAAQRNMQVIALSDHDTTDGLTPMANALTGVAQGEQSIRLIPAIEMSSGENGLSHVLGYGVREDSTLLQNELTALRRKRVERTRETIALIHRLTGITLSSAFLERADAMDYTVGRVHVARQMIAKQMVATVEEAFSRYLGVGKPAFIPLAHVATEDAIAVLRRSGAVPVLAHPMRSGIAAQEQEAYILRLKRMGLMGVEVFHPSASKQDAKRLYTMACKHDLLVTGGSDFHGDRSMRTKIGEFPAGWDTWERDIQALWAATDTTNVARGRGDH